MKNLILPMILGALVAGCNTGPRYFNSDVTSVAVLPPFSEAMDTEAWKVMWPHVQNGVSSRKFDVIPEGQIQAFYAKNNFRDNPAEINQYSAQELAKAFKADAIFYTNITRWGAEYLLIHASFGVEAEFALVDGETGERIWHGEGSDVRSQTGLLEAAKTAFLGNEDACASGCVRDALRKMPYAGWDPKVLKEKEKEKAQMEAAKQEDPEKQTEKVPDTENK